MTSNRLSAVKKILKAMSKMAAAVKNVVHIMISSYGVLGDEENLEAGAKPSFTP
nr:hypothetical protein [Leptothoe spongobia]